VRAKKKKKKTDEKHCLIKNSKSSLDWKEEPQRKNRKKEPFLERLEDCQ